MTRSLNQFVVRITAAKNKILIEFLNMKLNAINVNYYKHNEACCMENRNSAATNAGKYEALRRNSKTLNTCRKCLKIQ